MCKSEWSQAWLLTFRQSQSLLTQCLKPNTKLLATEKSRSNSIAERWAISRPDPAAPNGGLVLQKFNTFFSKPTLASIMQRGQGWLGG